MAAEWTVSERGHHRLEYQGHVLEITRRRPDTWEKRTYVVRVDGREEPVPVWDLKSAKTKAMRAVLNDPESGREVKRLSRKMKEEAMLVNGQVAEALKEVREAVAALEPEPLPEVLEPAESPTRHEVRFTITGTFPVGDISAGLTTIETVMQTLRERGPASCTLQMPKTLEM